MKTKKIAAVLASILTVVALSGCSLSRNVASLDPYAPSDGVVSDIGDLKVRNLLIIKGEGDQGLLIGSFVNSSQTEVSGSIQLLDADSNRTTYDFTVAPLSKLDLGYGENAPLVLEVPEIPGSMHSLYISDGMNPRQLLVPVLDGSLAEYSAIAELLN